jgi:translation initiation factor 1
MPKSRSDDDGTLVYSSGPDGAKSFGPGGKTQDENGSPASADLPAKDQRLRVITDARQRHGKVVTVIRGLVLTAGSLDRLAKELKRKCGAGGTVHGGTIHVQGDHRDRVAKLLSDMGYVVE